MNLKRLAALRRALTRGYVFSAWTIDPFMKKHRTRVAESIHLRAA